jgi:sterol desaturase/sphingolipid hydroxylase (fatty acid hydroxylase superfamily)
MGLVTLEHSKTAYVADFVIYGVAVVAATVLLTLKGSHPLHLIFLALAGMLSWTLIEYCIHRFLFHTVQPFKGWHADHHNRPSALLGAPPLASGGLMALLIFLPALLLSNLWYATAFTTGVALGYLLYGLTHHGMHHWRSEWSWWKQRKVWHALHHHRAADAGHYGLTTSFWDRVFGTDKIVRADAP